MMDEQFKIGDRVEFIGDGWSWPLYGQAGTVVASEDAYVSHPITVLFDGRTERNPPAKQRRCACRARHIAKLP